MGIQMYSTVTGGEFINILKNVSNLCRSVAFIPLSIKNPAINYDILHKVSSLPFLLFGK
jgi:hypothetical protein